jgi:hypothetical protein
LIFHGALQKTKVSIKAQQIVNPIPAAVPGNDQFFVESNDFRYPKHSFPFLRAAFQG